MFTQTDTEYMNRMFDYAPISLWEQDFSGIKRTFDTLRANGVTSLADHLSAHPNLIDACMARIRVLNVNQQTVTMCRAESKAQLLTQLASIFRDGMRHHFQAELLALWDGAVSWSGEGTNYTLRGDALDILLHWRILPGYEENWERVLVTIENITGRKQAERRFYDLFEASPISLWEEDYSALRAYFNELAEQGITELEPFLEQHPEIVLHCARLIRVLNVNQKTLELFGAASQQQLVENLSRVFRDEMQTHFAQELIDLWNGRLAYTREGINYALNGEPIHIQLDFRIMPGHERDFARALVSIQDISARKKAEAYLHYLGTHDALTGLFNRAYFEETLLKLNHHRREPVSVIMMDLDHLKRVNDSLGHQAGDALIRRAAEVFKSAFSAGEIAARIGGDEFVVLLPDKVSEACREYIKQITALININNTYYREPNLSVSIGCATSKPGLTLEKVIGIADDAMYRAKAQRHERGRETL